MSAKKRWEAKDMEFSVLVKYNGGSYWLHELSDRSSYLDGEDFSCLVDSKTEDNRSEAGWWCMV